MLLEVPGYLLEGPAEDVDDFLVEGSYHLAQLVAGASEVVQLPLQELVPLGEAAMLLSGQRVDGSHPAQLRLPGCQPVIRGLTVFEIGTRCGECLPIGGIGVAAQPLGDRLVPHLQLGNLHVQLRQVILGRSDAVAQRLVPGARCGQSGAGVFRDFPQLGLPLPQPTDVAPHYLENLSRSCGDRGQSLQAARVGRTVPELLELGSDTL